MTPLIRNFTMIKGDSKSFGLRFPSITHEITAIYISCSKNPGTGNYIFQKSLGNGIELSDDPNNPNVYIVNIAASDTRGCESGEYYYDIQLEDSTDVITVCSGTLTLEPWVTKA